MKLRHIYLSLLAALVIPSMAAVSSCSSGSHDGHDHDHDHSHHEAEMAEGHDHDHDHDEAEAHSEGHSEGEGTSLLLVHIEDSDADMLGIRVDTIGLRPFNAALAVNGTISSASSENSLVVAPTSGTLVIPEGVVAGARVAAGSTIASIDPSKVTGADIDAVNAATLRSAKDEYDRMSALREKGLVTASQLNSAREAYEKAKAMIPRGGASRRAVAPFQGVVTEMLAANGAFVQAGEPIASVAKSSRLTLQANVADRHAGFISQVKGAKVQLPGSGEVIDLADYNVSQLTQGSRGAAQGGYIPVIFTFDNPGLSAGTTSAKVYLQGAARSGVLAAPLAAVIEDQGANFVYLNPEPEHYVKTPVVTGQSDGQSVEILSGLHPGDRIVVAGTPMVRMAQSQGLPVQGHNHNH